MQQPPKKLSNIRDRDHPPTLEQAKAEMDAASKTAQAEACAKSKTPTRSVPPKMESTQPAATAKPTEPVKPAPPRTASLFDVATPAALPTAPLAESEEDLEPFAETEDTSNGEKTKIWTKWLDLWPELLACLGCQRLHRSNVLQQIRRDAAPLI